MEVGQGQIIEGTCVTTCQQQNVEQKP